MDLEFAQGILGALPELGSLGGMTVLVLILLRWQGQTATRHGEELDRMARLHDEDVQDLREENARLREQRDAAETRVREAYGLPGSHPPLTRSPESTGPTPTGSPRSGRRRRDP